MVLVGWAMDRLTGPRPGTLATGFPQSSAREWVAQLYPLFALLLLVVIAASVLHFWTGIEVAGAVMSLVPVIAAIWVMVQDRPAGEGAVTRVTRWAMRFTTEELPGYRGQIVLLFMAAFIGSLGAFALVPIVRHLGIDLTQVPPLVLLVGLVWLVLLTGQIGMNPILSVSLIVPLLPAPELLGLPPAALVVAITGGWALSGTTSPFTASVLLVAAFAKVPARYAGLRWSGVFSLVMGTIISAWAVLIALRWV